MPPRRKKTNWIRPGIGVRFGPKAGSIDHVPRASAACVNNAKTSIREYMPSPPVPINPNANQLIDGSRRVPSLYLACKVHRNTINPCAHEVINRGGGVH